MQELTDKQAFWKTHLDALAVYEGTAVEYARAHDLDIRQLYGYKKRLKRRPGPTDGTRFVSVSGPAMNGGAGVMVALPNGVRLALPDLDAPGLLERLARL